MSKQITKPQLETIARNDGVKIYYCMNEAMHNFTVLCDKIGYNAGILGWNWSAWRLPDGNILVCGYRTPSTIGKYIEYDTAKMLDNKLHKLMNMEGDYNKLLKIFDKEYHKTYKPIIECVANL